jgi:hypothetical protein
MPVDPRVAYEHALDAIELISGKGSDAHRSALAQEASAKCEFARLSLAFDVWVSGLPVRGLAAPAMVSGRRVTEGDGLRVTEGGGQRMTEREYEVAAMAARRDVDEWLS